MVIQEDARNPTELFPASEHAGTFLNKDRMVETRRILEARQCSEKSDGLAVGTTPGRTTKADVWMWRINEEERERERGYKQRRRERSLLFLEIHEP